MKSPISSQTADEHAILKNISEIEEKVVAREAEISRLNVAISKLHNENISLRAAIGQMHISVSWRLSVPIRIFGRLIRRLLRRQSTILRAVETVRRRRRPIRLLPLAQLPAQTDPNANYIFHPLPASDDGADIVRLNTLYHLSRSLE